MYQNYKKENIKVMDKVATISLEITAELKQALRKFAYEKELSISAALRYILADYLKVGQNGSSRTQN